MKKLITKLTLLVGAFLLLGIGNAKALNYQLDCTIYYDPTAYNSANPDSPLSLTSGSIKVWFWNYNFSAVSPSQASMSYDSSKGLFYYKFNINTTSYSNFPMYVSFTKGTDSNNSDKSLINQGEAQANWGGNTNQANGYSGMIRIIPEGIYDWNSRQAVNPNATVPTGVDNMLIWSNNGGVNVSLSPSYSLPCYTVVYSLAMADRLSFTLNSSVENATPVITVKDNSGNDVTNNTDICSIDGNVVTFTANAVPGVYTLTGNVDNSDIPSAEVVADLQNPSSSSSSFRYSVPSGNRSQVWTTETVTYNVINNNDEIAYLTVDDFNVSFDKLDITTPDLPTTCPSDMEYWEWQQMQGIMEANNNVDGFYQAPTISKSIVGNNLQVTVHYPVSGKYKLNLSCNNPHFNFTPTNTTTAVTVTVSPNLGLYYSDYYVGATHVTENDGININGMQNVNGTIEYYYDSEKDEWWGDLENAVLYTPGFYLGTVYYIVTTENLSSELTQDSSLWNKAENQIINISALNSGNQNLYLMFEKNGVYSEPTSILLTKTTSVPTGVEGIGAEAEGEAVYYNLQGVRVANPEHGIFVKVAGGKATKILM